MSLSDLRPINTKKAKSGAVNVFMLYLREENVTLDAVDIAVRGDPTGATLVALMDRFGLHLAFKNSKKGISLSPQTVAQYYGQLRGWLLERFPTCGAHVEKALLKKGGVLKGFCLKRPNGRIVKQAEACTKKDLALLTSHLYSTATTATDYQDVCLLVLLWYMLGRASDLTMTRKQFLSMCSNETFFIRFVRIKTSNEQGLSLFYDATPHTCPITALAVALALQTVPSTALLPHLPQPTRADVDTIGPLLPLSSVLALPVDGGLLERASEEEDVEQQSAAAKLPKSAAATTTAAPGVHAYVNRLLGRIAKAAGVRATLSSHSFRRGAAQHANSRPTLALQWIVDRGGWSMGSSHKVLMYVFNTTTEDRKVAKVLSNHEPDATVALVGVQQVDVTTRSRMNAVKAELFASSSSISDPTMSISETVADVLFAHLVAAYPQLKLLRAASPLVRRVEHALHSCGINDFEFLAWSAAMHAERDAVESVVDVVPHPKHLEVMQRQAAMLDEQNTLIGKLATRMRQVEELLRPSGIAVHEPSAAMTGSSTPNDTPIKRRKSAPASLRDAWYEVYTLDKRTDVDRKRKSSLRSLVSFMRIFAGAYTLDSSAADFCDAVIRVGAVANTNVQAFFASTGTKGAAQGTALKTLRVHYREGALDKRIRAINGLCATGLVVDSLLRSGVSDLQPYRKAQE